MARDYGISQPAVSQHLRVLRESGFASVRIDGRRRVYTVEAEAMKEVDVWLDRFRGFWSRSSTRSPPMWRAASASDRRAK